MPHIHCFLTSEQIQEKLDNIHFCLSKIMEQIKSNFKKKGLCNTEYMEVYTNFYDLCICKNAEVNLPILHSLYIDSFRNFIQEQIEIIVSINGKTENSETILLLFQKNYKNYLVFKKWMKNIFIYLERYYIIQKQLPKLCEIADQIYVNMYQKILPVNSIIFLINNHRSGEMTDVKLLYHVIKIVIETGFYPDFEKKFIEKSMQYYQRCSQIWLQDLSIYLNNFRNLLLEEKERSNTYLSKITYQKLLEKMFTIIIQDYLTEIINNEKYGFRNLLKSKKRKELKNMYSIVTYFQEGSLQLEEIFYNHVTETISELYMDNKLEYITNLIKYYQDFHVIASSLVIEEIYITTTCHLNLKITKKKKKRIAKIPTFALDLAYYCNHYLRNSNRFIPENIENIILNIGKLFILMDDKDLFKEHYKELLAKRLLNYTHYDFDLEKNLIQKFKIASGHNFTLELEGILSDISLKTDQLIDYPYEFSTQVLSSGYWPTYISVTLNLPEIMQQYVEDYTKFYKQKKKSLKLDYVHTIGTCEIKMCFQKKTYLLCMTPIQSIVVLLFNQSKSYNYSEIIEITGLCKSVLNQVLGSLCFSKKKILTKTPSSKKFRNEDKIEFNKHFKSKLIKIKFPTVHLKKNRKITEKISVNRNNSIEATIVRIMKTKKKMEHSKLILEVINQIRVFQPSIKHIKQRIEALIEREYLERNEMGYSYLA